MVAAALAWGCVYRAPITDPALLDQLGLLEPGAVTRATIEARLGPPEKAFEDGSIGAYRVVNVDKILVGHGPALQAHLSRRAHYWLMLQYGRDDLLVRRSLVLAPPDLAE